MVFLFAEDMEKLHVFNYNYLAKKAGIFIMKFQESESIELKREMIKDLDKEIIAFLNAHGGTIYIGVDDNGK